MSLRHAWTFFTAFFLAGAAFAQTPSAIDGFNPDVDGNVYVLLTQPDGKLLVGGQFTSISGATRNNLARLNADGSLDATFNPNPNGAVRTIVLQPDGRILIGGDFTSVGTTNRGRIARLGTDGSLDAAFNPNVSMTIQGTAFDSQVNALLVQPNGQIVAGGTFNSVQPTGVAVPFRRNYLARFNTDGSLDLGFDPNPNAAVLALANHVDNKLIIGGGFTSLWPTGDVVPSDRNRIARLNPNGTVDSEFSPNANNGVTTIVVQRDGKILVGGFFTTMQPVGEEGVGTRTHLARLNPDGSFDSEFYPHAEGNVSTIVLQPDGSFVIGGTFSAVWGRGADSVNRSYLARFNPDASLDLNFAPALNGEVNAIAFQPDGKLVVGGHFTRALPVGATSGVIRNHLARLNLDGSLDASFQLDAGGRTLVSITQTDGKIVIGGTFTNVGGATHNYLARLNADGSVDSTYNPDLDSRVYTMAYDAATNKVIIGGAFTTIGGELRNHIARINSNGTIDSEFYPNIDGQVGVILLQTDGRVLVGGTFNNIQPVGTTVPTVRTNLLRLNANGTLDTAFHPNPNSSISALAVQSDGKILIGGLFSTLEADVDLTPVTTTTNGVATSTVPTGTITTASFLARVNNDGTVDTKFIPIVNGQVNGIVVQSDSKIVISGAFTAVTGSDGTLDTVTNADGTTTQVAPVRNRIARLTTEGNLDRTYDPNANGNVITMALQPDGKVIIGGDFTTLTPNAATVFTLRKYAARLNADGTVDPNFDLDINELGGNRVDSIRIQPDGRVFIGGSFSSLQPKGSPARLTRANFARLTTAGLIDPAFDANTGGATGAIVNAIVVQPDNKVIVVGNFADLGGAKSANIARFEPEGVPDPEFSNSLTVDGPVNAVVVRPNGAPVPSQLAGFAWLNANGTLRSSFTSAARLSGEVDAVAVEANGSLLVGGAFANLDNTTGGNLVRFTASGAIDPDFNPTPNGDVAGIAIQPDGRVIIVGTFTVVDGQVRNHIARLNPDGHVDVTYDPNASARINAVVMQSDGKAVVGGTFTSFTPNFAETAVTRNYMARINPDGTVDSAYDPAPNSSVNALALESDGKVIAGGAFTAVQPNGGTTAFTRNNLARINTDGTVDQNFDPNPNAVVNALIALANGQIYVGGSFTTLQPNAGATVTRNNIARINSDAAVDPNFNPNANGSVTTLALQADGSLLVGGAFTTFQPNGTNAAAVNRNHLARLASDGSLDLNFNPDINGSVTFVGARPDGTVFVGGIFSSLQLNGSIFVGGSFASVGGVPARNLASLNDNGSVNATFQPRPDGAVNALLVQPDAKVIAGGAFTNIAGVARNRIARFNADGTLDAAFNSSSDGIVTALALQNDGKILAGSRTALIRFNGDGSRDAAFQAVSAGGQGVRAIALQSDGKVLVASDESGRDVLRRYNPDGGVDGGFSPFTASTSIRSIAVQADAKIIVGGTRLDRLNPNGGADATFNPAPNGDVGAVALQSDGRLVVGGRFSVIGGTTRVGLARLGNTSPAAESLGVAANRSSVTWMRSGPAPEISAALFEFSTDRITWTPLGSGARIAGTPNWQIGGLNLPATGLFYIRVRGLVPANGTSSGISETVREFNFSNPLPVAAASVIVTAPSTPIFDPLTGIAPHAAILAAPGEGSIEIMVSGQSPVPANAQPARMANLSTRGRVAADSPLILGFAIAGTDSRRVLVRAVGPTLASFGVSGALPATRLQVYDANGALIGVNEGWNNAAELAQTAANTGAFPFAAGSADSAAVLTLTPGNYTAQVVDPRGAGGVALAEIYDAGTGSASRLVNVSSRGAAGIGADALISGFVVAGEGTQRVLLRGVGPGLARFGATSVVADPSVALFDAQGHELGSNDNWVSTVPTISGAAVSAGAFALDPGSKDAAVLADLPAGTYTIQVSAPTTGAALLEIYEVR